MQTFVKTVVITGLMIVLGCAAGMAQGIGEDSGHYVQNYDNGKIDWQDGQVTAKGIGVAPPNAVSMAQARAMAVRAATVVARRNLLEIIKGVQIDSTTTVENYMVTDDTVVAQVRGFLQNSQVLDTAYMSDGSVEVVVGINLRGGFADALLPKTKPFKTGGVSPLAEPKALEEETPSATVAPQIYTGLVIDVRGLNCRPAMTPKILDEDGNEVYGSAYVSREYAVQQGMAGYAKDMQQARLNPRVAANPLVIKAVGVKGKAKTDPVIANVDANTIRNVIKHLNFLEKCRVMIVLD